MRGAWTKPIATISRRYVGAGTIIQTSFNLELNITHHIYLKENYCMKRLVAISKVEGALDLFKCGHLFCHKLDCFWVIKKNCLIDLIKCIVDSLSEV